MPVPNLTARRAPLQMWRSRGPGRGTPGWVALLALALLAWALPAELLAQGVPLPGDTGQAPKPGLITLVIADSATGEVLPFATAGLVGRKPNGEDTTLAQAIADVEGVVRLPAPARPGRYRVRMSYVGYPVTTLPVRMTPAGADLGRISLGRVGVELEEVTVEARRAATRQRGDTTEFNAGSFAVNADASAQELVGKMPGVTIAGGQIEAQGEIVQQVLVDGKPFFGQDPTQALQALPAEIIDRVQLLDQRSDQTRFTGFDDGQRTKTINIITKPDRRRGVFGRAQAGYGTWGRYQAGLTGNIFRGDRRLTILSQANNINQQNFSFEDIIGVAGGGGGRGGRGGGGGAGGGGRGRGIGGLGNFFVGQQSGITETSAFGLNFSDQWGKGWEVSSSYFFNRAANLADQATARAFFGRPGGPAAITGGDAGGIVIEAPAGVATQAFDTGQRYDELSVDRSLNHNHRVFGRLELTGDTNQGLVLRPRLSTQGNGTQTRARAFTQIDGAGRARSVNELAANSEGYSLSMDGDYRRRLGRQGRTISIGFAGQATGDRGRTYRLTETSSIGTALDTSDPANPQRVPVLVLDSLDQTIDTRTRNNALSGSVTYTEPLSTRCAALAVYRPGMQWREADRLTRDRLAAVEGPGGRVAPLDTALSSELRSRYLTQAGGLALRYQLGQFRALAELSYQWALLDARQSFPSPVRIERPFPALLPQVDINIPLTTRPSAPLAAAPLEGDTAVAAPAPPPVWERSLGVQVNTSTSPPDAAQLQPVFNNINPLQLTAGNPDLRQQYRARAVARLRAALPERSQSAFVFMASEIVDDYIGQATTLVRRDSILPGGVRLPAGGQISRPQNLGRQFIQQLYTVYSRPLPALGSQLSLSANGRVTSTPGQINGADNRARNHSVGLSAQLSSNLSPNVDFTISSRPSYEWVRNSLPQALDFAYLQVTTTAQVTLTSPTGWVASVQATRQEFRGLAFTPNFTLLGASAGRKFGPRRAWDLRVQVYDALGQNNSVVRSVSDTFLQDTQTNVLQRYYMVTLSYQLRRFGGGQQMPPGMEGRGQGRGQGRGGRQGPG